MCLAMVYRGEQTPENLILSNVQKIECFPGEVVLTDLMERQITVKGELISVDLVGNSALIRPL